MREKGDERKKGSRGLGGRVKTKQEADKNVPRGLPFRVWWCTPRRLPCTRARSGPSPPRTVGRGEKCDRPRVLRAVSVRGEGVYFADSVSRDFVRRGVFRGSPRTWDSTGGLRPKGEEKGFVGIEGGP